MKKTLVLFVIMLSLVACSQKTTTGKPIVGVIQFGDFASLNDTLVGIETALGDKVELVVKSAQGEAANVITIAQQFVNDDVDCIIAITTQAAQAAVGAAEGKIPVVFVAVSDPESAGLTGLETVTGVTDSAPLDAQFALIKALTPSVKTIGLMHQIGDPNGIYQTKRVKDFGESQGYQVVVKGATNAADLAMVSANLAESVDAFYLITDGLIVGNTGVIVTEASRKGVVVYASEDGQFAHGVLASNSIRYTELGEQAAELTHKIIFDNVKPVDLPIEGAKNTYPTISKQIAQDHQITIPETLIEYTK